MPFVRKLTRLGVKLSDLFLIFKTPELGSGALWLKLKHRAGNRQCAQRQRISKREAVQKTKKQLSKGGSKKDEQNIFLKL